MEHATFNRTRGTLALSAFAALLAFTSPQPVQAEGAGWNMHLGAGAMFYEGDDELESGGLYEARVGYDFNTRWTLEGSIGGMPVLDNRVFDDDRFALDDEASGILMGVHGLFHLNGDVNRTIDPYISTHISAAWYDEKVHKHRNHWDGLTGAGAGVNFFLNDAWSIRGDYSLMLPADSGEINHTGIIFVGYSWGRKAALAGGGSGDEDSAFADENMPRLGVVYFAFDSALLDEQSRAKLKEVHEWMQSNPDESVLLTGHCDERGTNEYNLALGDRRARSAYDYLVSLGADRNRLSTVSFGEERPADSGHNEEAWAKNRRVECVHQK